MKRPSEHDYEEIQEISRLASDFIDAFYWNEDKIKAFNVASKIVKYLDFYIKDYNITMVDLLIRNKCQENSDRHNEFIKQNIKKLNELLPSKEPLTEDEKNELLSDIDTPFPYLTDEEIQEILEQMKDEDTKFNVEHFVKEATQVTLDDDVEDTKLCYSLEELSDPKIFQEALDTLNNLDVNVFTGEVKMKNKEKEENVYND